MSTTSLGTWTFLFLYYINDIPVGLEWPDGTIVCIKAPSFPEQSRTGTISQSPLARLLRTPPGQGAPYCLSRTVHVRCSHLYMHLHFPQHPLTWSRDNWRSLNTLRPRQIDVISQTTFSWAFSWMKMLEFRLQFHWNLFPMVPLTIFHHWFR